MDILEVERIRATVAPGLNLMRDVDRGQCGFAGDEAEADSGLNQRSSGGESGWE